MIKISIIIPIYNTEKYLSECIESVLTQSLYNVEVICINDGSTDNSLSILKDYAEKDNRIVLINKENEGAGIARNVGIKEAKGNYIFFIDSDDCIAKNTLDVLFNIAEENNLDLLQMKWLKHFNTDRAIMIENNYVEEDNTPILSGIDFSLNNYSSSYAGGKLWKRSFIIKNDIYFSTCRIGEDQIMTFNGFLYAKRFMIINFKNYYYRIHNSSITRHNKSKEYLDDHFDIAKNMLEIITVNKLWNNFGFMKRLFVILYRLNLHNNKNTHNDRYSINKYKIFITAVRNECKVNRQKNIRFTTHIERFYLLPRYFWKFFKMA